MRCGGTTTTRSLSTNGLHESTGASSAVHPFRNGNGRCTRLVADLYLVSIEQPAFTWGAGGRLDEDSDARRL